MNKIDDGGPAFPLFAEGVGFSKIEFGMSLRNYFAAKVMAGMLAGNWFHGRTIDEAYEVAVDHCFMIADMMVARSHR